MFVHNYGAYEKIDIAQTSPEGSSELETALKLCGKLSYAHFTGMY